MSFWQTIQIAVAALTRTKMRSFLTVLGVIIGVGAVIAMVSIGEGAKARVAETFDRGVPRSGVLRQMMVVVTQPNRGSRLHSLNVPTLVIHGLADKMVHVSGGRATAAAIPSLAKANIGRRVPTSPSSWLLVAASEYIAGASCAFSFLFRIRIPFNAGVLRPRPIARSGMPTAAPTPPAPATKPTATP